MNTVAEDLDSSQACPSMVSHDLNMVLPIQLMVNIEAKVVDYFAWRDGHIRRDGIILQEDTRRGGGTVMRLSEKDEFSFGAFQQKARLCEPVVCRRIAVL